jgi:hypothetical protein
MVAFLKLFHSNGRHDRIVAGSGAGYRLGIPDHSQEEAVLISTPGRQAVPSGMCADKVVT